MYMHHETNHLTREGESTPCVTMTVIVHAEDGVDPHAVFPFMAETVRDAINNMHADIHADEAEATGPIAGFVHVDPNDIPPPSDPRWN
jgi:hypothetical protein